MRRRCPCNKRGWRCTYKIVNGRVRTYCSSCGRRIALARSHALRVRMARRYQ